VQAQRHEDRAHSDRLVGVLRAFGLVAALIALSACSASRVSNVHVLPGKMIQQGAKVLLLPVPDGPSRHSGSATLAAVRDALVAHGFSPLVSDAAGLQAAFDEARSFECHYVLRAEVTHWEDRLTWMSNRPDKATLSVEVYEVASREMVASGTHAVTGAIEEYVDRHPDRFIPELADGSLGRVFGWTQTVFAEE
jgi:Domain of unknown function (DUF4823)